MPGMSLGTDIYMRRVPRYLDYLMYVSCKSLCRLQQAVMTRFPLRPFREERFKRRRVERGGGVGESQSHQRLLMG